MPDYRLANQSDAEELAILRFHHWREGGSNAPEKPKDEFLDSFKSEFKSSLENAERFCWIATHQGRIIASIYILIIRKLPKPSKVSDQFGYLSGFYVEPEFRNQSIGKELLTRTKLWALEEDLELLIAWPSKDSRSLWQRESFASDDALICQIRDYIN